MNYVWAGLLGFVFGSVTFWWGYYTGKKVRVPQSDACSCSHSYRSYSGYHYARRPDGSIWVKITSEC